MKKFSMVIGIMVSFVFIFSSLALAKRGEKNEESLKNASYISSAACGECHKKAYANFTTYSKKAQSGKAIQRMSASVPPEDMKSCPRCHTTGYEKGGFISFATTPEFGEVGCETCHGPGSIHRTSRSAMDIDIPTLETCQTCHTERVHAVNYKPLMFSAAH